MFILRHSTANRWSFSSFIKSDREEHLVPLNWRSQPGLFTKAVPLGESKSYEFAQTCNAAICTVVTEQTWLGLALHEWRRELAFFFFKSAPVNVAMILTFFTIGSLLNYYYKIPAVHWNSDWTSEKFIWYRISLCYTKWWTCYTNRTFGSIFFYTQNYNHLWFCQKKTWKLLCKFGMENCSLWK